MSEVIDTPTQTSRTTAATELLALLCERYPETFKHDGEPPRPLAIGTGARLVEDLGLAPDVVNAAMRLYTRRRAYQQALAQPGAMRVDLTGQPTAPVAEEHQTAARNPHTSQGRGGQGTAASEILTWDDVQAITQTLATVPPGEARTMKLTLVGRPGNVETRDQAVLFRMQGKPPGSLPKGLPPMPNTPPMTWVVVVALRQWNRVKESLATNADDQIIIEGVPCMEGTQPLLMAQSCTSVLQQRQRKEAQRTQDSTP